MGELSFNQLFDISSRYSSHLFVKNSNNDVCRRYYPTLERTHYFKQAASDAIALYCRFVNFSTYHHRQPIAGALIWRILNGVKRAADCLTVFVYVRKRIMSVETLGSAVHTYRLQETWNRKQKIIIDFLGRKFDAAFITAPLQHVAASLCSHSFYEAVNPGSMSFFGLKCSLWH